MSAGGSADWLRAFAFRQYPVRGAVVTLADTWTALTARRQYPAPLNHWLADMLTALTLVRSGIKAPGRLSLQLRSQDNPHLLSVECDEQWRLRGTARYRQAQPLGHALDELQAGLLSMQLEPPGQRVSYQGVVPLQGDCIAAVMQHYFQQSEQLPTEFVLGSGQYGAADFPWGFMLQRMPGEMLDDDWQRLILLAGTLRLQELRECSPEQLLSRLFPDDEIELFAPQTPCFFCACSQQRVARMLLQLGHAEARDILAEQGQVQVGCEHCGEQYAFDSIDIEHLFSTQDITAPVSDQLQ